MLTYKSFTCLECGQPYNACQCVATQKRAFRDETHTPSKTRLEKLRLLAEQVGATGNYFDAVQDILYWPEHKDKILDDLESAIKAHQGHHYEHPTERMKRNEKLTI